jgi:hypothetical protein
MTCVDYNHHVYQSLCQPIDMTCAVCGRHEWLVVSVDQYVCVTCGCEPWATLLSTDTRQGPLHDSRLVMIEQDILVPSCLC